MQNLFERLFRSANHLNVLHKIFVDKNNFDDSDIKDFEIYDENSKELLAVIKNVRNSIHVTYFLATLPCPFDNGPISSSSFLFKSK